jgi:hypothetical protein
MVREFRRKWELSEVLRAFCLYTVLAVSLSIFLAEVTWTYHVKSLAETPPGPFCLCIAQRSLRMTTAIEYCYFKTTVSHACP